MNTDIRVDVSFRGHRKRRKLRRILGLGSTDYLLDLWIGVAMTKPDGDLAGWTNEELADEAGWEGDANAFAQALKEAGFLDGEEGAYSLHDWGDHQPWVVDAPKRSEKGKKAAEARWGKAREAKGGAQEMPGACQEKAPSMHQACSEHARSMHQACSGHCSEQCPEQCPSPSPFPEEERQGEKDNARARVDRLPAPEVLPPEFPEDEPAAPVQGLKTRKASSDPACYAAFQRVVSLWPDRKEIERAKRAWNALWEAGDIIPHAIEDAILDHKARDAEWADGCHPRLWRWLENRRWTEQPKERPAQAARASPSSAPPSPTRYQDLRDLEQRQERERMRAMKEQLDAESRSQADQGQPQRVQSAPHAESAIQPGRPGRPLPVDGGRPGRKALA